MLQEKLAPVVNLPDLYKKLEQLTHDTCKTKARHVGIAGGVSASPAASGHAARDVGLYRL